MDFTKCLSNPQEGKKQKQKPKKPEIQKTELEKKPDISPNVSIIMLKYK